MHRMFFRGAQLGLRMINFILSVFQQNTAVSTILLTVIIATGMYALRITTNKIIKIIAVVFLIVTFSITAVILFNKYNLINFFGGI